MKVIGAKNLAQLLRGRRYLTERDFAQILNEYGDEFASEFGLSEYNRAEQNKKLVEKLGKEYVDLGNRL